jgi:hypothetical protein
MTETKQGIGHLTLPIEDNILETVQATMKAHGATMQMACETPDGWWIILLPAGTLKVHNDLQATRRYTIVFPDGFTILYDEPIRHRSGRFTPPAISLDTATHF